MKVLIVCVNYNTYESLNKYLLSIKSAVSKIIDIDLHIFIADNSTKKEVVDTLGLANVHINEYENLGYFGAAYASLKNIDAEKFDYIIISNVDLVICEDFFIELERLKIRKTVGWLAPSIISTVENRDKNPQRYKRCSRKKLIVLSFLYKTKILYYLYAKYIYEKIKKSIPNNLSSFEIYSGHGSFIILTKGFFETGPFDKYPCFLFGEEIFLAEILRRRRLTVNYIPSLKIIDNEHESTSKLPSKKYIQYNCEALEYLIRTFF